MPFLPALSLFLLDPAIDARLERAQQADSGVLVEERPKQLTFNHWVPHIPTETEPYEAADPTRPMPTLDGRIRVDASGRDGFLFPAMETFLHGGNHDRYRFRTTKKWADGTPTSGPYHTGNHGWDGLVAQWPVKNARGRITGYQEVAYLGMMEQPYRLVGARDAGITAREPVMPRDNYTRTRHALDIERLADGSEIWTSRGSVTGATPGTEGKWISPGHHHGYGGRPLMDNDGRVIEWDGSPWMIYEEVSEQKARKNAEGTVRYLPWVTEVLARRMKSPYAVYRKGERLPDGRPADEVRKLCSVRDRDGRFNPASDRHGDGYLIEGFNLVGRPVPINGKRYWIGFASPNNYTESYGVTLWYRPAALGPIGSYQPVVDDQGVWKDVTAGFRERYGLTGWFGRADGFFTAQDLAGIAAIEARAKGALGKAFGGNLNEEVPIKLVAHGVNPKSLPEGFKIIGWPTAREYNYYLRAQWLLFARLYEKNGQPDLRILDTTP